jgi:hypothetical protein
MYKIVGIRRIRDTFAVMTVITTILKKIFYISIYIARVP